MDEIIKAVCEMQINGLEPSLILLGTKQQDELYDNCLGQMVPVVNVNTEFINVHGSKMKVIRMKDNDLCEVFAKDRWKP